MAEPWAGMPERQQIGPRWEPDDSRELPVVNGDADARHPGPDVPDASPHRALDYADQYIDDLAAALEEDDDAEVRRLVNFAPWMRRFLRGAQARLEDT